VPLTQTREIARTLVRVGDTVEAGQALFELAETDSAELRSAREALAPAEYNYNTKLLGVGLDDYDRNAKVTQLQEALQDATALRDAVASAETAMLGAEAESSAAHEALTLESDEIADINARIPELDTMFAQPIREQVGMEIVAQTDYSDPLTNITNLQTTVQTEQAVYEAALNTAQVAESAVLDDGLDAMDAK
jgi:multidrug efflux pump subunit AcrA (membrane-fusion protein)